MKHRPGEGLDDYDNTKVVGTCNGLLCLINEDQTHRTLVLWNISTGDYKALPNQPVKLPQAWSQVQQLTFYGFRYDSINDDYKLVRIVPKTDVSRSPPFINEVKVYSLKTNTWRKGEVISNYYFHENWRTTCRFRSRTLHLLGVRERKSECFISAHVIALMLELRNITKWSCSTTLNAKHMTWLWGL
ncbi:hypothetical protein CRYUN_Cryun41cG0073600 [Craigia yunnanensis]